LKNVPQGLQLVQETTDLTGLRSRISDILVRL
jgi:hypothetical protein